MRYLASYLHKIARLVFVEVYPPVSDIACINMQNVSIEIPVQSNAYRLFRFFAPDRKKFHGGLWELFSSTSTDRYRGHILLPEQ